MADTIFSTDRTKLLNDEYNPLKSKDLNQIPTEELQKLLADLRFALVGLKVRVDNGTKKVRSSTPRVVRIQIARILTILQKRGVTG
jgi:ribosomal protein L29